MKIENMQNLIEFIKEKQEEYSKIITADSFFSYLDSTLKNTLSKEEKEIIEKQIKKLLIIPENVKIIIEETGLTGEEIYMYYLKDFTDKSDNKRIESINSYLKKVKDTGNLDVFEPLMKSTIEEEKSLLKRRKEMLNLFIEEANKIVNTNKLK